MNTTVQLTKKTEVILWSILLSLIVFVMSISFQSCQKNEEILIQEESYLKSAPTPTYYNELIDAIDTYVAAGILSKGVGNSLISKINNAIKSAEMGNVNAALNQFEAVINSVNALVNAGIIPKEQGIELIDKIEECTILINGNFTDSRDGNEYPVVLIGEQIWMAKNLAYLPAVNPPEEGGGWGPYYVGPFYYVYGYSGTDVSAAKANANYATYGVLYNFAAAMNGEASSNANPSGVQGICPTGWHLPSITEWLVLSDYLINNEYCVEGYSDWIAKSLAANTNWIPYGVPGCTGYDLATNNRSGFSALPGGCRYYDGIFMEIETVALWWSSTEDPIHVNGAGYGALYDYYREFFIRENMCSAVGLSIRCVKN